METYDFLQTVLGDRGWFCLFSGTAGGKPVQKFYTDVEQLANAAKQMDENGRDVYFALATYQSDKNRTADNADLMGSFYIDLDCGPSKPYPTQREAVAALVKFTKKVNLPKPITVSSGYGVHAYWPLTEPVGAREWVPAAERLKALMAQEGLEADPAVTADAARILRLPGTHNYKKETAKPVKIVSADATPVPFDLFVKQLPAAPLGFGNLMDKIPGSRESLDRIAGNTKNVFAKIMQRTARGEGCAQLGFAVKHTNQLSEPFWRAALSVANLCEDRERAITAVSKNHPDYDPDDADRKAKFTKGPYHCTSFDAERPGVCQKCSHFGKIKSPIVLGSAFKEAEPQPEPELEPEAMPGVPEKYQFLYIDPKTIAKKPEQGEYPDPYKEGAAGAIFIQERTEPDEDGKTEVKDVLVYHDTMYVTERVIDPEYGEVLVWRLHLPKDGVREFVMPLTALTSREDMRKTISKQGVLAIDKQLGNIMRYGLSWVRELQQKFEATPARTQFGWVDDDKWDAFLLGDRIIKKDEVKSNPPSSGTEWMFKAFPQKGTLDGWKENANFLSRDGCEVHQFIVGLGLGSPIMTKFHPLRGFTFNVHGTDSGHGKTAAMRVAASAWGDPDRIFMRLEDTGNSLYNRMETLKNVPFYVDEITKISPRDASVLAYQITQGMQKARMESGSNAERHRGDPWALTCVTSANASLAEKIAMEDDASQGQKARLIEYATRKVVFPSKEDTDKFNKQTGRHTAWAGPMFLNYIMHNSDEVDRLIAKWEKHYNAVVGEEQKLRYYVVAAVVAMVSIEIARKLDLVEYDIDNLDLWIRSELLPENIEGLERAALDPHQFITDFVNENYNSFFHFDASAEAQPEPDGANTVHSPDASPRVKLVGRYDYDTHTLYIAVAPLKRHCAQRAVHWQTLLDYARAKLGATEAMIDLNRGTNFSVGTTKVIKLKFDDPKAGQ